jgi:hypothetical protein
MITKVYVAGASAEIERARKVRDQLLALGMDCTSSWMRNIDKEGKSNPTDATPEKYAEWALADTAEADVFLLLLPAKEIQTVGAWVELGAAHLQRKTIVMSGPHRPIFTPALATHHVEIPGEQLLSDQAAVKWIHDHHRKMVDSEVSSFIALKDRLNHD